MEMGFLEFIFLSIIIAALILRSRVRVDSLGNKYLREAANELGLRLKNGVLQGQVGDHEVAARFSQHEVRLIGEDGAPDETTTFASQVDIAIGRRWSGYDPEAPSELESVPRDPDLMTTGDSLFDEYVEIRGAPLEVLPLLNSRRRDQLFVALTSGFGSLTVSHHSIRWKVKKGGRPDLVSLIRVLLDMARDQSLAPGDTARRLTENTKTDPSPGAQIVNLELLQTHFPNRPETIDAARALAQSTHPEVRLRAARCLAEEGVEIIRSLVMDQRVKDDTRIEALRHLARDAVPTPDLGATLESLLSSTHPKLQLASIEEIGRLRYGPLLKKLIALEKMERPELIVALAAALARMDDPAREEPLIRWLFSESDPVRAAAIKALGESGTVAAVEPLLTLARTGSMARAAREAILSIQARMGGREKGQLTLSDLSRDEGGLTVAPDESGALSIPESEGSPPS